MRAHGNPHADWEEYDAGEWTAATQLAPARQRPTSGWPALPARPPPQAPVDNSNHTSEAAEEAVRLIVAAAQDKKLPRKKGIPSSYVFPYELVERGYEGKHIKKGDASREEYTLGLRRLESNPDFPRYALAALSRHQDIIAQDNCTIPWPVVRRYSEDIFTRIADGRIPLGWSDTTALDNVRIEHIAMAQHLPTPAPQPKSSAYKHTAEPRNPYDKATNGIPCAVWNRDTEKCEKADRGETHTVGHVKYAHICGFCANVRHIVAGHPESSCYSNKARDRPAQTNTQPHDKDF